MILQKTIFPEQFNYTLTINPSLNVYITIGNQFNITPLSETINFHFTEIVLYYLISFLNTQKLSSADDDRSMMRPETHAHIYPMYYTYISTLAVSGVYAPPPGCTRSPTRASVRMRAHTWTSGSYVRKVRTPTPQPRQRGGVTHILYTRIYSTISAPVYEIGIHESLGCHHGATSFIIVFLEFIDVNKCV